MMMALLKLVTTYICYAPIVRQAFLDNGFPGRKLAVAHNSLINRFPVLPGEKTGAELGLLFIGRLRQERGLGLLLRGVGRGRGEDGPPPRVPVIREREQKE